MRVSAYAALGVLLASLLVTTVGALEVQVIGRESGAVFDLTNTVVGVTKPHLPLLPKAAIAVAGVFIVYLVTVGGARLRTRYHCALLGGFAVAVIILSTWSFMISGERIGGGDEGLGVLPGWKGWVEKGGENSAVHVLLLVTAGLFLMKARALVGNQELSRVERPDEGALNEMR